MRRVLRIFLAVGAALSLLACIAAVVLWVRRYSKTEWWSRFPYDVQTHEYGQGWIYSGKGKVATIRWRFKIDDALVPQMEANAAKGNYSGKWLRGNLTLNWPTRQHWWEKIVYVEVHRPAKMAWGIGSGLMVIVPYWVFAAVFFIWPATWGISCWRTRRRFAAGKCQNCG